VLVVVRYLENAEQVDEPCEGAWVVTGFGRDLLESVANRVGVDVHLLGGAGDVEISVGEGADRLDGCREIIV
jgi:hypothetical protein